MQNNIRALHKSLRVLKYIKMPENKNVKANNLTRWRDCNTSANQKRTNTLPVQSAVITFKIPKLREDWGIYMNQNSYHLLKGNFSCFIFPLPPQVLCIRKRSTHLFPLQKAQHAYIQEQLQTFLAQKKYCGKPRLRCPYNHFLRKGTQTRWHPELI